MASTSVIHRFEVPVDDRWHFLDLPRGIQHVATRRRDVVEVWAYTRQASDQPFLRQFRVYGTGQPMPPATTHIATAIAPGGDLVWHLIENHCPHESMVFDTAERPEVCPVCGASMTVTDDGKWIPTSA